MPPPATLHDLLLLEMGRRNTDLVADLIFQKPELFEELFQIYLKNEEPVSRRAAWVMDVVTESHPEMITHHLTKIVENLPEFSHDGLKRHSLRIIARSPISAIEKPGELITICFDWLLSTKEAVAVKVYCMEILFSISQAEPDIKKELSDSIEWRMHEETPGFRSRAKKLLKKLHQR